MAKTRVAPKKKRGPPPTGKGIQVVERWHPSELAAIDAWIASSSDKTLTRAHAIRRLVALAGTVQHFSQVGLRRGRKRIKLNGPFHMEDGLIDSPMTPKDSGVVCVNISRVWIKFERTLKLSGPNRPVKYREGQGSMSVSERLV